MQDTATQDTARQDTATALQATITPPQSTNSPAARLLWERLHRLRYTTTVCVLCASHVRSTDITLRRFRPFCNRFPRSTSQHAISRLACNPNGPPTCRVVHRVTFDSSIANSWCCKARSMRTDNIHEFSPRTGLMTKQRPYGSIPSDG